jgi:hypothetical protein
MLYFVVKSDGRDLIVLCIVTRVHSETRQTNDFQHVQLCLKFEGQTYKVRSQILSHYPHSQPLVSHPVEHRLSCVHCIEEDGSISGSSSIVVHALLFYWADKSEMA